MAQPMYRRVLLAVVTVLRTPCFSHYWYFAGCKAREYVAGISEFPVEASAGRAFSSFAFAVFCMLQYLVPRFLVFLFPGAPHGGAADCASLAQAQAPLEGCKLWGYVAAVPLPSLTVSHHTLCPRHAPFHASFR